MLYKIGNWINESFGQILDSIKSQYMNISTYRSLIGMSYVKLPAELRSPKKDWSKSKKKKNPERITQKDKEFLNNFDYSKIEFPVSKEDFIKIETKNNISINVFYYENKLNFPIHISDQMFESSMDLLRIIHENKSHYV